MLNEHELAQAAKEAQEAILKALDDIVKNNPDKNKKAPVSKRAYPYITLLIFICIMLLMSKLL